MLSFAGKQALQVACGVLLLGAASGCAHDSEHHKRPHPDLGRLGGGIMVSGTGEAHGSPDLARTSVGIEVRAASVQEATQQANAQMTNLLRALKEQGIAENDLRTHGYSVSFDRDYRPPQPMPVEQPAAPAAKAGAQAGKAASARAAESAPVEPPQPEAQRGSYVVSNMVEVTVRNLEKLGDVLSAATAAGANNVWGITFDVADKRMLIERARAEAFEHAKADAERLAALSGVKLGKLVMVADNAGGGGGGPQPFGRMAMESVPVQGGQLTISHQVSLHYEIATGDEGAGGEHHEQHEHVAPQ